MSEQRVSGRYAKSLIDLAIEQKVLESIYADMVSFRKVLEQNHALVNLLKSPVVPGDKKMAVLHKAFEGSFQKLTLAFMDIVVRKKRDYYLPDIAAAFIEQYYEINMITTAHVKTAVSVSEQVTSEVRSFIEKQTGKKVMLETSVDPNLIGGLVIQMEDKLYDASISGKLRKAKQELLNTHISK